MKHLVFFLVAALFTSISYAQQASSYTAEGKMFVDIDGTIVARDLRGDGMKQKVAEVLTK